MELGLATFGDVHPGTTPERRMRELIEEIELADQLGLDVFAVGEHHRPDYAVSAPAVVLGAAAVRHRADPPLERRHGAQLRRPGARLPAVRDGRPALRRPRRDHGRARLVHRVVPAVRPGPQGLRRPLRREARPAAAHPRGRARHWSGPPAPRARRPGRLPAAGAGPAPRLDRRRRLAGVGRPRRHARPAADDRDHRRAARALRPARRPLPRGGAPRRPRPGDAAAGDQHARVPRRAPSRRPTPPSCAPTSRG